MTTSAGVAGAGPAIELDFVVRSSSMLWLNARAGLRVHSGWARPPGLPRLKPPRTPPAQAVPEALRRCSWMGLCSFTY